MAVYQLGADPEFHVVNKRSGKVVTPTELRKDQAFLRFRRSQSHSFIDGTALEPWVWQAWCREEIRGSLRDVIAELEELTELLEGGNKTITFQPTVTLRKGSVLSPDEKIFGCAPDIDVYTMDKKKPVCPPDLLKRYQGGHAHVSFDREVSTDYRRLMVMLNDYWTAMGATALMSERAAILERERKQFYGQSGSARFKNYDEEEVWNDDKHRYETKTLNGFEYRVLSTTQFLHSPYQNSLLYGMLKGIGGWPRNTCEDQLKILDTLIGEKEMRSIVDEVRVQDARDAMNLMLKSSNVVIPYETSRRDWVMKHTWLAFLYAAEKGTYWDDTDDAIRKHWHYDAGHETLMYNVRRKVTAENYNEWRYTFSRGDRMDDESKKVYQAAISTIHEWTNKYAATA